MEKENSLFEDKSFDENLTQAKESNKNEDTKKKIEFGPNSSFVSKLEKKLEKMDKGPVFVSNNNIDEEQSENKKIIEEIEEKDELNFVIKKKSKKKEKKKDGIKEEEISQPVLFNDNVFDEENDAEITKELQNEDAEISKELEKEEKFNDIEKELKRKKKEKKENEKSCFRSFFHLFSCCFGKKTSSNSPSDEYSQFDQNNEEI